MSSVLVQMMLVKINPVAEGDAGGSEDLPETAPLSLKNGNLGGMKDFTVLQEKDSVQG